MTRGRYALNLGQRVEQPRRRWWPPRRSLHSQGLSSLRLRRLQPAVTEVCACAHSRRGGTRAAAPRPRPLRVSASAASVSARATAARGAAGSRKIWKMEARSQPGVGGEGGARRGPGRRGYGVGSLALARPLGAVRLGREAAAGPAGAPPAPLEAPSGCCWQRRLDAAGACPRSGAQAGTSSHGPPAAGAPTRRPCRPEGPMCHSQERSQCGRAPAARPQPRRAL